MRKNTYRLVDLPEPSRPDLSYKRVSERSSAESTVQHALFYLTTWFYFANTAHPEERTLIDFSDGDHEAIDILGRARKAIFDEIETTTIQGAA